MYYARIDEERRIFIIEDREGNIIASRDMPWQGGPSTGRNIMNDKDNQETWQRVYELAEAANNAKVN